MDQPVGKTVNGPPSTDCATGELLDPVPPNEYYAKRLLQLQTIKTNNDMPEHIRKRSFEFRQSNGTPLSLKQLLDLVTAHKTLLASLGYEIRNSVPTHCSTCFLHFRLGSEVFHEAPKCNPLHLTSLAEQYYSLPPPDYRREAFDEFKTLLTVNSENSLLGRLGAQDARSVSRTEYVDLLDNLSAMFFPIWGKRMVFDFDFLLDMKGLVGSFTHGKRESFRKQRRSLIQLCPIRIPKQAQEDSTAPPTGALNSVSAYRLGVLLHELCHAFLQVHACKDCPEYLAEVQQMKGHGFAWQRIALMVETEAWSRLGIKLDLVRDASIVVNWDDLRVWPSRREVQDWKLLADYYSDDYYFGFNTAK